MPPCNFKTWTGKPCPSCGMTTSFALLIRGDVANSLRANWVGTLLAGFCMVLIPYGFVRRLSRQVLAGGAAGLAVAQSDYRVMHADAASMGGCLVVGVTMSLRRFQGGLAMNEHTRSNSPPRNQGACNEVPRWRVGLTRGEFAVRAMALLMLLAVGAFGCNPIATLGFFVAPFFPDTVEPICPLTLPDKEAKVVFICAHEDARIRPSLS